LHIGSPVHLSSTFQPVRDRRGSALNCLTTRSHAPLWWPESNSIGGSSSAKQQCTSILQSGPCHDDDLSDSEDDMPVTLASTVTPAVLTPVQCQTLFQSSLTAMDTR
jgi:hypothetical protein